jgi:hypothetical protein
MPFYLVFNRRFLCFLFEEDPYSTRQHGSNTQHDMSQNKWEGEQQKDLEAQRVTLLCQSSIEQQKGCETEAERKKSKDHFLR